MTHDDYATDIYIDPRDHLVERIDMAGQEVHLHYRDIPESDITTVHGLRVTTPLRTVIDVASDGDAENLALMVGNCLGRGLFTVKEAWARISEPDMADDPGAQMLRGLLTRMEGAA